MQKPGHDLQLGMEGAVYGGYNNIADPFVKKQSNRNQNDRCTDKEPEDESAGYGPEWKGHYSPFTI
jgi:hypothetical protein